MNRNGLIVRLILVVLLGISTGFIVIDFANFGIFLVPLVCLGNDFYKDLTGGPGGNSGTGNGENSTP